VPENARAKTRRIITEIVEFFFMADFLSYSIVVGCNGLIQPRWII
jgi:hypothetical protein